MLRPYGSEVAGESRCATGAREFIRGAARSHGPVLLLGEAGTGKELAARAIHFSSSRRNSPFLMVDCSLFYERELERELFGYRPGQGEPEEAARQGLLEFSPRGSLYAANVEEMSPSVQQRLLNFLDTGYLQAVGSGRPSPSRVRLIFSSEKNLEGLSRGGLFSQELFRRFTALTLDLAPLRDRPEDVAPLVHHFAGRLAAESPGGAPEVTAEALEALHYYPWPGNVDELKREVARLVRSGHHRITPELLATPILQNWRGRRADPAVARVLEEIQERIQEFRIMSRLDAEYGDVLLDVADWDTMFKAYER